MVALWNAVKDDFKALALRLGAVRRNDNSSLKPPPGLYTYRFQPPHDNGQGQVRITDFGLATVTGEVDDTVGMSGTPAYMAPEQLIGEVLDHPQLKHLKIVQGWDPHLARALQTDPHRCGITSGPMSLAVLQYMHLLGACRQQDWQEVAASQIR